MMNVLEIPPPVLSILVVDDVVENVHLLSMILKKAGYTVRSAASGRGALEAVAAEQPDLILLDIQMPDLDGYEVCERLRRDPATESVPVIMITAHGSESSAKARGLRSGANDYLTKPVAPDELLARIETQLRLRELENQRVIVERLRMVHQMITTLHHEINNPLTGILNYAEIMLRRMEKGEVPLEEAVKAFHQIRDSSIRIRDVMAKLHEITEIIVSRSESGPELINMSQDR
jgi:DNA-binding response OmpR family regulator